MLAAAQLLDGRVSRVSGGTFHSTGNLLLRTYGRLLGFDSSFSIMDQGDSIEALEHAKKELTPPLETLKGFPKGRTIGEIISHARGSGRTIGEITEERYPHLVSYASDIERIQDSTMSRTSG